MVKLDCFYHSFENDGNGVYSQCKFHTKGVCPCETCDSFISKNEVKDCCKDTKNTVEDWRYRNGF